ALLRNLRHVRPPRASSVRPHAGRNWKEPPKSIDRVAADVTVVPPPAPRRWLFMIAETGAADGHCVLTCGCVCPQRNTERPRWKYRQSRRQKFYVAISVVIVVAINRAFVCGRAGAAPLFFLLLERRAR